VQHSNGWLGFPSGVRPHEAFSPFEAVEICPGGLLKGCTGDRRKNILDRSETLDLAGS
jgi:hypothetical protein